MTAPAKTDVRERTGLCDADFGYPAWRGFLAWAIEKPEMRAHFTKATGIRWPSATEPIEGVVERFALWATEHYWGTEEVPPNIRERIALIARHEERTGT